MCEIPEAREAGYGIKSEIYGRDSHSLFRNDYHPLEVGRKGCSGYKTMNICALHSSDEQEHSEENKQRVSS
jgi:hypothetical protein